MEDLSKLGAGDVADIVHETNRVLLRYLSKESSRHGFDHQRAVIESNSRRQYSTRNTYRDHVSSTARVSHDDCLCCIAVLERTLVDSVPHSTSTRLTVAPVVANSSCSRDA
jgi:hypothetical protein